ncbi:ABC transporter permease [Anoxybacillus geothermalis]|nr:Glutathione transport system permease protein GsiC [Geobacillus sp. 12AMOR1]KZM52932.1 glutathione ABC transporter permease [Geobacillus stearothermophilus]MED4877466.1 ABC transporter permease [Anoxybacillus geothermalis]MED4924986.1 ABC transporter permease [Anoxybacillus geothermalis]
MSRYLFSRIVSTIPVLFGVTIVVFLLIQLIPGDPARSILGGEATPEAVEDLREEMGLNDPWFIQYFRWLTQILQGDLGYSYTLHTPIADELLPRFVNSMILTVASLLICVILGVGLGLISALRKGTLFDKISIGIALLGASMPVFWVALMLMWLFAIKLQWFPVSGMYNMRNPGGFLDLLHHLVLPAFATATVSLAVIARLTRSAIIDVVQTDYVKYFRSFGLSNSKINIVHVLRNSLPPIINISGLQVGYIIGGSLFSEVVFNWPGIGQGLYVAITSNDYPTIQAGILLIAVTFVIINLIVDIVNMWLSPKLLDSIKAGQG